MDAHDNDAAHYDVLAGQRITGASRATQERLRNALVVGAHGAEAL